MVAAGVVGEGDAQAVGADGPVEGVGGGREVDEEGDGHGEGGELRDGDGGEAGVVEGASIRGREGVRFSGVPLM